MDGNVKEYVLGRSCTLGSDLEKNLLMSGSSEILPIGGSVEASEVLAAPEVKGAARVL